MCLRAKNISDSVEDLANATTLKVHFKDLTCIKYRRDMYMTWDGLLAAFGGIFGLCLGGSVISLVETAYYFTFRFYTKLNSERLRANGTQASTRQVSPLAHKKSPAPPLPPVIKLQKNDFTVGQSKLQTFGKHMDQQLNYHHSPFGRYGKDDKSFLR